MAAKKYDGPDKFKRCACGVTLIVCEGHCKREKGLPSCCHSCAHEGDENE